MSAYLRARAFVPLTEAKRFPITKRVLHSLVLLGLSFPNGVQADRDIESDYEWNWYTPYYTYALHRTLMETPPD